MTEFEFDSVKDNRVVVDGSKEYITTSMAAKELSLSHGTIQKLVDRGELSAILTIGGHRRISQKSILAYKTKYGYLEKSFPNIKIAIFHFENDLDDELARCGDLGLIVVLSSPMDFLFLGAGVNSIFIDARNPWIQVEKDLKSILRHASRNIFIYNCEKLPPNSPFWRLNPDRLLYGGIHLNFVLGYLTGSGSLKAGCI